MGDIRKLLYGEVDIYDKLAERPHREAPWMKDSKFEEFFKEIADSLDPKGYYRVVEVGSWLGDSAIVMAKNLRRTEIVCVDTWLGAIEFLEANVDNELNERSLERVNGYPSVYYSFLSNIVRSGQKDKITPFAQTSTTAALWFARSGFQLDLIYIDGSHEGPDVCSDLHSWWPRLKIGGMIFGDDYGGAHFPGVKEEVDKFFGNSAVVKEQFWMAKKDE